MDQELLTKIKLRDLILAFFDCEEGKPVSEMSSDGPFSAYKDEEISAMRLALSECGLIAKISGYGHGSSYQTTDDGKIFMEAISKYEL